MFLLLLFLAAFSRLDAQAPFVMFASTSDPQVFPVLRQFVRHGDYIGARISMQVPELGRVVGREHQFVLPGGLDGVRRHTGCGAGTPGVVVYDIEHWSETPASEQEQPGKSIAAAAHIVHAAKCQQFALAPDGQYMGLKEGACAYDLDAGIYRSVDWTQVDVLSIQAQRLLSDTCAGKLTVDDYASFVSRVAAYVRGAHPGIEVVSQLSFRYTPPEKMAQAMLKLARVVDGFYLAYPSHQKTPCHYCSAENVAAVLRARPAAKVQE